MKKRILAMLLASAMVLSLAGCNQGGTTATTTTGGTTAAGDKTTAAGDTTTAAGDATTAEATTTAENVITKNGTVDNPLYVWMWNDDVKKILDSVLKEVDPDLYARIVYVNTGGSNVYQTKVDAILADESSEIYPDVIALEADYILKYTNSESLTAIADLGITDADLAQQYQYTKDIATNEAGKLMASSWQATPGSWAVRADLAKKYLGTDDPAKVQEFFATWDKVLETAKLVNEKSGGATKLVSGIDDVKRVYMGARASAWYDDSDKLVIDPAMTAYMDFAKALYTDELTFNTNQWGDDWNANKAGDKVLAWPSCTWFTYWCLSADYKGQYIQIAGPQNFYWGGTWLAATKGCSDKDAAAKLIKYMTCDADFMAKINAFNADYVNNKTAIDARITACAAENKSTCDVLVASQNFLELNKALVDGIDASTMTAEDQAINSAFDVEVLEYSKGTKTLDEAIASFKAKVVDTFDFIKAE